MSPPDGGPPTPRSQRGSHDERIQRRCRQAMPVAEGCYCSTIPKGARGPFEPAESDEVLGTKHAQIDPPTQWRAHEKTNATTDSGSKYLSQNGNSGSSSANN